MPSRPTLLLADDHRIFLEGVCKLLEADYDIVGASANGRELVDDVLRLQPDLVVLDIGMPLMNGIEACRRIRQCSPSTKILFLTQQVDRTYVHEAFRSGSSGYVSKQSAASELLAALREITQDRYYISRSIAEGNPELLFHERFCPGVSPAAYLGRPLTPRQREVLQLVAEGKSAKEIASTLGISVKTVEFHKGSITSELGLRTTAELTRYALAHGIVQG